MGRAVQGSNPDGGEIFRTCQDRPWRPPSLLYNGYRVFPGGKERPGRDADSSPPSSAVVMKGYNYTSTPLWAVRPLHSFSSCTGVHFILLCALGTFRCTFTQFSVGKKTNPTDIKCETEGAKTLWYELYHTLWSNKRVGKGVFFFLFLSFEQQTKTKGNC